MNCEAYSKDEGYCYSPATRRRMCNKHYMRWLNYGDSAIVNVSGRKRIDDIQIAYRTMHHRLRKEFGPASDYMCEKCLRPAKHWAYIHDCTDERENKDGRTYCHHTDHYIPLCVKCHKSFDRA